MELDSWRGGTADTKETDGNDGQFMRVEEKLVLVHYFTELVVSGMCM